MEIILHSKYLQPLTNKNLCSIFQQAKQNGDFATYLKISEPAFLWKYKGMIKYKKCLGI